MKKVSVIMPCYNDGKYIQESIKSVMNQTYKNIELIIIDDGSTDNKTINILSQMQKNSIKLLKTKHIGTSGARNKGIENATGDYILPLDSDDIIDITYIEKAIQVIESNSNIGIVYCRAELFGEENKLWELPTYSINEMLVRNIIFVTALFRKEDWILIGGYDTSFNKGLEDYDFWLSILELGREVVQIPEILFKYRIKPISRNKLFYKNIQDVKETDDIIYLKHKALYHQNIDKYVILLRNLLIDEKYKNEVIISKINKLPLIGIILKNKLIKNKIKSIMLKRN